MVINAGIQFLPSAINFVIFLFNDIYGFVHWKLEEKNQIKNDKNQSKNEETIAEEIQSKNEQIKTEEKQTTEKTE